LHQAEVCGHQSLQTSEIEYQVAEVIEPRYGSEAKSLGRGNRIEDFRPFGRWVVGASSLEPGYDPEDYEDPSKGHSNVGLYAKWDLGRASQPVDYQRQGAENHVQ
jgi:hypothetical protein